MTFDFLIHSNEIKPSSGFSSYPPIFLHHPSCGGPSSSSDPLQSVLQTLERQYEEEKRCALERQRQMYEQELQQLRQRLTPEKPSHLLDPSGLLPGTAMAGVTSPSSHRRMRRWSEDRWETSLSAAGKKETKIFIRHNLCLCVPEKH